MQSTAEKVSSTILSQLGGPSRVRVMVSGRDFGYTANGTLSFKFSGSRKTNLIRIELNGKDLYNVTFFKAGRFEVKPVKTFTDVYADSLKETFEQFTGLYLSL